MYICVCVNVLSVRGKQSQACHHSNRIAAIRLTICFNIGAFPVKLGHFRRVEKLPYKIVEHGHHFDSGAKTRSIIMMFALEMRLKTKATVAWEVQQG